jgi:hypothetical protein
MALRAVGTRFSPVSFGLRIRGLTAPLRSSIHRGRRDIERLDRRLLCSGLLPPPSSRTDRPRPRRTPRALPAHARANAEFQFEFCGTVDPPFGLAW